MYPIIHLWQANNHGNMKIKLTYHRIQLYIVSCWMYPSMHFTVTGLPNQIQLQYKVTLHYHVEINLSCCLE